MAEKLEETHARFVKSEETTRERHRQQVTELTLHHKTELEAALGRYHDDVRRLEDKHLSQTDEYEERSATSIYLLYITILCIIAAFG